MWIKLIDFGLYDTMQGSRCCFRLFSWLLSLQSFCRSLFKEDLGKKVISGSYLIRRTAALVSAHPWVSVGCSLRRGGNTPDCWGGASCQLNAWFLAEFCAWPDQLLPLCRTWSPSMPCPCPSDTTRWKRRRISCCSSASSRAAGEGEATGYMKGFQWDEE